MDGAPKKKLPIPTGVADKPIPIPIRVKIRKAIKKINFFMLPTAFAHLELLIDWPELMSQR